jgi:hypothetical protein
MRGHGMAGTDESGDESGIGPVPLRRLLAHGLGDALSSGKEFTHHPVHPDGDVTACFADGSSDRADLLVDPDGAGSTVGRPVSCPPACTTARPMRTCRCGSPTRTGSMQALTSDAVATGGLRLSARSTRSPLDVARARQRGRLEHS